MPCLSIPFLKRSKKHVLLLLSQVHYASLQGEPDLERNLNYFEISPKILGTGLGYEGVVVRVGVLVASGRDFWAETHILGVWAI
jgi:hypothetical protein